VPALSPRIRVAARRYPLVLVALGVTLYSAGPVMLQASGTSGPVFGFWRLWFGAVVLGVATMLRHLMGRPWPARDQWRWAAIAGVAFGIHQLLFFTAVRMTTVVDVALMNALAPVVTAVGALWMFAERPGRRFWLWATVAIVGAALLAVTASQAPSGDPAGMLLATTNVVFFAAFFLVSKKARDHLPVVPFLFGTMLIAALVATAFVGVARADVRAVTPTALMLAAGVAVGPGALGHLAMTWPLRYVPANIPPVMRQAQPVLSGLLAWWVVGEALAWRHLLAGVLVVVGAAGTVLGRDGRALRADAAAPDRAEPDTAAPDTAAPDTATPDRAEPVSRHVGARST
jgi:drug/metabolite transporter (DMT)-like permease